LLCKRAVVALSGGMDSAMAAVLLLEQGWQVLGVHLLLTPDQAAAVDLKALGKFLGIAIRQVDLRREFQHQVIDYFRQAYLSGITPNPCVRCNEQIKFGSLLKLVQQWGYEVLATGHYARLAPDAGGGIGLWRGVDRQKEQSYFLHRLRRDDLGKIIFPVGELTKDQVRAHAEARGLLPYILPGESQELCFIPGKYGDYLRSLADISQPGPIINRAGALLGSHRGLVHYTVGQRQRLGLPAAHPYYVLELIPEANTLVVGSKAELLADTLQVDNINWLITPPPTTLEAQVRLRYRHPGVPCRLQPLSSARAKVELQEPQAAITPGQAAVFYQGERVLGGGWIQRGSRS
jgi:tRNA-specific 2-thiouridylase